MIAWVASATTLAAWGGTGAARGIGQGGVLAPAPRCHVEKVHAQEGIDDRRHFALDRLIGRGCQGAGPSTEEFPGRPAAVQRADQGFDRAGLVPAEQESTDRVRLCSCGSRGHGFTSAEADG
ncbi:hypothetical protein GCM10010278_63670 [Streptomyces melanogenes]|nr:hypothetical protein GCM10010278_63670 [Streptomyces melanogenes]